MWAGRASEVIPAVPAYWRSYVALAALTIIASLPFASSAAAQATGACCDGNEGICVEGITEADCASSYFGVYVGDGTTCPQGPLLNGCGACCDKTTGTCELVFGHGVGDCEGAQENFFVGQDCADITCAAPGAVCGDNIREGTEQCDGTDDAACPGSCQQNCRCAAEGVPAVSGFGMLLLTLALLGGIKLKVGRRQLRRRLEDMHTSG